MTPDALIDALIADSVPDLQDARLQRVLQPVAPAAGAEFSATVPGGDVWELRSVRFTLTTSAVAGNRVPQLLMDDGTTEFFRTASATAIPASTIAQLSAFPGSADSAPGLLRILPFPDSPAPLLWGGCRLRTLTTLIDAGDAYSAPVLLVRRLSMADVQQSAAWLSQQVLAAEISTEGS